MSAAKLLRHLRLLPAVIVVGGALLAIKSVGLVHDAYAQTAMTGQVAAPPPSDDTQVAVADPSVDDADSSSAAEVQVLTSLSKRRAELDAREQDLSMQANLIAAAEKRVDDKIASLKDLQSQMQNLLGQRDAAEQAQLNSLVKTYSSMKPADAARIFNQLDDTVELNVAALMKSDVLGAILAKMQPDMAQKLTERLANRLKLPDPAAVAAATAPVGPSGAATPTAATPAPNLPGTTPEPQQTASLTPPAATPTPVTPAATTPATPAPAQAAPAPAANTAKPQAAAPAPAAQTPPAKQAAATPAPNANTAKPTATAAPTPIANGAKPQQAATAPPAATPAKPAPAKPAKGA